MTELKPCPFCGERPKVEVSEPCNDYPMNAIYSWQAYIYCCVQISTSKQYKTGEEALQESAKVWNNRPAEAKIKADGVRDAQAEIMEGLTSKVVNSYEWDEYINKLEQGE